MKSFLLCTLATLFLLCPVQISNAQNPVKKVKYLKHSYEGEVGKKKVPNGQGVMLFEGFYIRGEFHGNEVSDALVVPDAYDVYYLGDVVYDESQSLVLKSGGKILARVYVVDEKEYNLAIGNYGRSYISSDLRGIPVVVRTLDRDETITVDSFDLKAIPIKLMVKVDLPKELNPPASVPKEYSVRQKIKIGYNKEEATNDGSTIIRSGDWVELKNDTVQEGSKQKRIFLQTVRENPQFNYYKDDEGRVWNQKQDGWSVHYPNGDYLEWQRSNWNYLFRCTLLDNYTITRANPRGNIVFQSVVTKSGKSVVASFEMDGSNVTNRACEGLFDATVYGSGTLSSSWRREFSTDEVIKLQCQDGLTDEEIQEILGNELFKPIVGVMPYMDSDLEVFINDAESRIGTYNPEKKEYVSEKSRREKLEAARQEKLREVNEHNKKVFSKIEGFKKRFGYDPTQKGMRGLVKVGSSFKLLNDYFDFTYKLYMAYYKPISFRYDYPDEDYTDYTVYDENGERKSMGDGYYFKLSIDRNNSRCYDFGDTFNGKRGYIWVNGDKITSVVWY
ncbi:MAG: hypothetical protein IJL22_01155 [Bacteroidales bacterium]|nr:hypothetical protein [Bacteroidales bacterium]